MELAREGARSRLGPVEEGLWDISDSYKSSFCEKRRPCSPVMRGEKPCTGVQRTSYGPGWAPASLVDLEQLTCEKDTSSCLCSLRELLWRSKEILSFNAKPAARVVIFLLLCLFHFPLVARHPFTSVKILKDDDLTQTSFRLSVFSFVQSHFCLSTYSWLFSLSLLEIWSLPCVGPVHTPPLTWSQASLDQTLKFSWLISCLPLTHRAPEARRMEAAHCWAEGPCWGIWGAGDQRPLLAALVLERVPGCCPY